MEDRKKEEESPSAQSDHQVIVAGGTGKALGELLPLLEQHSVEVHEAPEGAAVVRTASQLPVVDLVLIAYPLPDMKFSELIAAINESLSPARPPQIVAIVSKKDVADIAGYVKHGIQILPADLPTEHLRRATAKYLRKAPRPATRVMVRMEVELGVGKVLRFAQSMNISSSGMLIRTKENFPLGSQISVEFTLPDDQEPIRAEGRVVRHSDTEREKVTGMGVQFTQMSPDHQGRLEDYVRRKAFKPQS